LEHTIKYLQSYGVQEFVVCVAYLKKQIIDAFGDGSELGVSIAYGQSDSPLGTGGQLKTAEKEVEGTFLAMNGDIVTSLNIGNLVGSHRANGGVGTIALKKFDVKIPYGNVTTTGNQILRFEEKPTLKYNANAGIYVLEPEIFDHIQVGRTVSLETEVFPGLLAAGKKLFSYYEDANWADVGSMADFERVNDQVLSTNAVSVSQERASPD